MNKQKEEYIIEQLTNNLELFLWQEKYLEARFNIIPKELKRCKELAREKISRKYGEQITTDDLMLVRLEKDLENEKWEEILKREEITGETAKLLDRVNSKLRK